MKYMVMECHDGYAVLMDEDSRFVRAANLQYSVGQTVTDPVLMNETQQGNISVVRSWTVKLAAAAAGLLLISAGGLQYYNVNMKTQSVVTIRSDLKIEMALNSKGKVIKVTSSTPDGQELIKNYSAKNKDSISAANDLLELELENGYISDGDTVEMYIDTADDADYTSYKSELEQELSKLKVNVRVKNAEDIINEHTKEKPTPPEAPKDEKPPHEDTPPVKDADAHEPPKPAAPPKDENADTPPAPPEKPDVKPDDAPPPKDDRPTPPEVEPPKPADPPSGEVPPPHEAVEPPKPADPPANGNAEPPAPPAPPPHEDAAPPPLLQAPLHEVAAPPIAE